MIAAMSDPRENFPRARPRALAALELSLQPICIHNQGMC